MATGNGCQQDLPHYGARGIATETFNIFNHANINSINSSFSFTPATNASDFGYAATAGDMRQMEFSARLNF